MVLDGCTTASLRVRTEAAGRHALEFVGRIRRPASHFDSDPNGEVPGRVNRDLMWPGHVDRTVVVASEERSGSTLLCHALGRSGLVGVPLEYLQPVWFDSGQRSFGSPVPTKADRRRRVKRRLAFRRHWWEIREIQSPTLPDYLDGVIHRRTTSNSVFALKVHWSNFERARDIQGFRLEMLPQPVSWIHIQRNDRIAQAVSYVKAAQSGVFALGDRPPRLVAPVHYNDGAILSAYRRFEEGARQWVNLFSELGATPIDVVYEELEIDYEGTIARVLTDLGFPDTPVPEAVHRRQADEINAAWITRFRSLHPELDGGERRVPP